jgi:opacity protein-like surface antigen
MRSVKILIAAGAASLLSSSAFAADMAIAPPPMPYAAPVADFGGWYLRGDIGFSNQSVQNIRNTNPALYANLLSLDEKTGFDTGGVFGLGAGYQFNNWFRVDVTGQYRGHALPGRLRSRPRPRVCPDRFAVELRMGASRRPGLQGQPEHDG